MLDELTKEIVQFVKERDWEQFHSPKNMSIAISLEANELMENFVWTNPQFADLDKKTRKNVEEELADVMIYALEFFYLMEKDPEEAIKAKLAINTQKYPLEKARGKSHKYTELR